MIKCEECGCKMSDRATSCPHCGCPHKPKETPEEFMARTQKWLDDKRPVADMGVFFWPFNIGW